jgi:hypothetical protein
VVEQCTGPIQALGATKNLGLPEVLRLVLPERRQTLRGAELQRLFNINTDHVRRLRLSGEIVRIREKLPACGPNASPRYTVASVARLLEKRRVI